MTAKKKRKVIRRSTRRLPIAAESEKLSSSERELLAIRKSEWEMAKRQERVVKTPIRTSVEKAAERAGRSTRTVRRLMARYRVNPTLLTFLPRKRGQPVGARRLDPAREVIVEQVDPAVRRAAIWLTSQVITCPAPTARLNAMRLGRAPQVDFLGPREHEGLAWLADRAQTWPADYYARCWEQFLPFSAINEATGPSIKVRSAIK